MKKIQQLREQRAKLIADARKILDAADKVGRDMTAEEDQQFTRMMDEADGLKKEIDAMEQAEQARAARAQRVSTAEAELREFDAQSRQLLDVAGSAAPDMPGGGQQSLLANPFDRATDEQRAMALQGWFLDQVGEEPSEQHQTAAAACGIRLGSKFLTLNLNPNYKAVKAALKSNVPGSGGVLKLGQFLGDLELAMLAFGPMLEVAQIIRTNHANPFPWPTANDTGNTGRQIGESAAVAASTDPTFAARMWGAYKFTSDEILVPFELLRDASTAGAINLAGIIGEMLGERLGRIQNTKFTVGTGAATPYGIVPRSTLGKTAASATAIAADELFDLQHSVPRAYRNGAGFMANDSTFKAIRKLKDSQNRYLWEPSLQAGQPDMLLKWPTFTNDDMAAIATGEKTLLAGQFSRYKVRQVNTVRLYRLTERHRENDQDAFLAFVEADGDLLDPGTGPVRHLIQA